MPNIATAYEAFWFLTNHPKFRCRDAALVNPKKPVKVEKGERIRTLRDQMPWRKGDKYQILEFAHEREAMSSNLDIFYAKVDKHGVVNTDAGKNTFNECWLEFGPIKQTVSDGQLKLEHYHDTNLDCGAPTFDEALVKLARLVLKHYGDYTQKGRPK